MASHPAIALLETLFSKAALDIRVPSSTAADGKSKTVADRDVAFYDETLSPVLRLVLPSSAALPAPVPASQASFGLPLPSLNVLTDDTSTGPPRILTALLSILHITLEGAYVPQQRTATSLKDLPPGVLAGSSHPVPSVQPRDAAYQHSSSSQPHQQNGQSTPFYSAAWAGNTSGPQDARKGNGSAALAEQGSAESKGIVEYVTSEVPGEKGRWIIKWFCQATVAYMRPRFADPVVALTATLSLRLSRAHLSQVLSLEDDVAGVFQAHDLLGQLLPSALYGAVDSNPLPTHSIAQLKLANLGDSVLSTKLVTPAVNQNDMLNKLASASRLLRSPEMAEEESDMTGSAMSSSRLEADLGDGGRRASANARSNTSQPVARKDLFTDEVRILRRSCRAVLDVRTAISVRMRTLLVPPLLQLPSTSATHTAGSESDEEESEAQADLLAARDAALSHALALCVELENVADSGMLFEVRDVRVNVSTAASAAKAGDGRGDQAVARLLTAPGADSKDAPFPLTLKQGEQHNLLYFLELSAREELLNTSSTVKPNNSAFSQRSAAIVVDGRPVVLTAQHSDDVSDLASGLDDAASATQCRPTQHFLSTWNCQLDTSALDDALARRRASALPDEVPARLSERNLAAVHSEAAGSARHRASALAKAAGHDAERARSILQPQNGPPRLSLSVPGSNTPLGPSRSPSHPPMLRRDSAQSLHDVPRTPRGPPHPRQRVGSLVASSANAMFTPNFTLTSGSPQAASPADYFGLEIGRPPGNGGTPARTPSGGPGLGLLAHARMRAASVKLEAEVGKTQRDKTTQMQMAMPQSPLPPSQAAAGRRSLLDRLATVGSGGTAVATPRTATQLAQPAALGNATYAPDEFPEVHSWSSKSFAGADPRAPAPLVVTTRVLPPRRSATRSQEARKHSVASAPVVQRLGEFTIEVLVANRSSHERSFVISWPTSEGDHAGARKGTQAGGPSLKQLGARGSHAVMPEDNHVLIGPILPNHLESAHLTMRALLPGIHDVAPHGLVLLDVQTGEGARLCGVGEIVIED